jgi:hypothetical protein
MKKLDSKLSLKTETVKALTQAQLRAAKGGMFMLISCWCDPWTAGYTDMCSGSARG